MKTFCVVVLGFAAGCATAREDARSSAPIPPETAVSGASSVETAPVATETPAAESQAAIASVPVSATSRSRWSGAGADDGPEVRVRASRDFDSPLHEDRLVGGNEQPEWTTERPFTTTRAYVLAPNQIEVEQWWKLQSPRHSGPNHFFQTEVGFGFEGGFQVDLYANYGHPAGGPTQYFGESIEGRYALAKWGQIPLNPTLYGEFTHNRHAPDVAEGRILLAEEICPGRLHWAGNLIYEQELGGVRATEIGASMGIMRTIVDGVLGAGVEAKFEHVTGIGFRSLDDAKNEFLIGPTLQWRPTPNTHLDVTPLFGLTKTDRRDPRLELWVVFGIDFGPSREERWEPTSTRAR